MSKLHSLGLSKLPDPWAIQATT